METQEQSERFIAKLDVLAAPLLWFVLFSVLYWLLGSQFILSNLITLMAILVLIAGRHTIRPWVTMSIARHYPSICSVILKLVSKTADTGKFIIIEDDSRDAVNATVFYWLDFSSITSGYLLLMIASLRLALIKLTPIYIIIAFGVAMFFAYFMFFLSTQSDIRDWTDKTRNKIVYYRYLPVWTKWIVPKRYRESAISFPRRSAAIIVWMRWVIAPVIALILVLTF